MSARFKLMRIKIENYDEIALSKEKTLSQKQICLSKHKKGIIIKFDVSNVIKGESKNIESFEIIIVKVLEIKQ